MSIRSRAIWTVAVHRIAGSPRDPRPSQGSYGIRAAVIPWPHTSRRRPTRATLAQPIAGACGVEGDCSGVRRPRKIGLAGRSRACAIGVRSTVPEFPRASEIGRPPGCRTQPFQAVRPVSAVYKAAPLAGAVDKIGSELPSCTAFPRYERCVTLVHLLASKWLWVMESDHRRSAYETDVLPLN